VPAKKKGMGVVGWLAIGCLVVLVLGLGSCFACGYYAKRKLGQFSEDMQKNPEMTAAKLVVQMTPDLELVSTDDAAGTLTVKNTKTGEVVTVSVADAKEGKFSITTDQGTATVDANQDGTMQVTDGQGNTATYGAGSADLPSWVPAYPNGTANSNYSATTAEGKTAMVSITTADSVQSVLDFYEKAFQDAGLKVQKSLMSEGGSTSGGTLSAESADSKHQVAMVIGVSDGQTQVSLTWTEKP
jgi:uncharacterized protein YneF (UPF0154 family)